MSFRSILKKITGDLKTVGVETLKVVGYADEGAQVLAPVILPTLSGPASAILKLVFNAVNTAETAITGVQQGIAKKLTAGTIVTAELPNLQEIIASFGSGVVISPAAQAALGQLIDTAVTLHNELATTVSAIAAKAPPLNGNGN